MNTFLYHTIAPTMLPHSESLIKINRQQEVTITFINAQCNPSGFWAFFDEYCGIVLLRKPGSDK